MRDLARADVFDYIGTFRITHGLLGHSRQRSNRECRHILTSSMFPTVAELGTFGNGKTSHRKTDLDWECHLMFSRPERESPPRHWQSRTMPEQDRHTEDRRYLFPL